MVINILNLTFLPGQELGLKIFTPPYLAPTTVGSTIQNGVNYASASAGILNETGKLLVRFIFSSNFKSFLCLTWAVFDQFLWGILYFVIIMIG